MKSRNEKRYSSPDSKLSLILPGKVGQMEMIGLVVIVILITLGILFMAQFALREKPQNKIFLHKELAASSLTALLKTTVKEGICPEGAQPQFSEVLVDCARHFPPESSEPTLSCAGKHSCVFFAENAQTLLDSTLGSWRKDYELKAKLIRAPGTDPELLLDPYPKGRQGCPSTPVAGKIKERDSSGTVPLPTLDAGLVELVLFVCD